MPNIPEVKFYSPVNVPSMIENGYDVINSAELDAKNYLTQNQTITLSGDMTGSGTTSISATLANSGVTAGTYNSVTVNSKGIITSGSTSSNIVDVITVTSNHSAATSGGVILGNGELTITLPAASAVVEGTSFTIKNISTADTVTIIVASSGTVDGYTSVLLDVQYATAAVISDGASWWII